MDKHARNKLVLKVCRLFPSSFTFCHLSDVAETTSINGILHGPKCPPCILTSSSTTSAAGWFTSSDDVKTRLDDLSISSNSGDSFRLKTTRRCHQMKSIDEGTGRCSPSTWPEHQLASDFASTQLYYRKSRRRKTKRKTRSVMGESYAVEKRSSDPHTDFRASMVEMILEKQIFAAQDLETLLLSFLSLNHASYHGIIFHVFSEICQTLFSNS